MIFFALAFVLGAFCLQQMPELPSLYWVASLIPFAAFIFYFRQSPQFVVSPVRRILCIGFGFLLGFLWAATYAAIRLSDALPHDLETKPI